MRNWGCALPKTSIGNTLPATTTLTRTRRVTLRKLAAFAPRWARQAWQELLRSTIHTAVDVGAVKKSEFERVIVDTIVQEKAIAHPVDSRLLDIGRRKVVAAAKRCGMVLKQTFEAEGRALRRRAGG
jgi:microcystin degradation protein MlrC